MKTFYLLAAIVGTVLPWWFFGGFFASAGIDIPAFIGGLFANGPAAGFSIDVMLSIAVFWVWSRVDSVRLGVAHWWVVIPAGFLVGLSLALPLYLYLREGASTATA